MLPENTALNFPAYFTQFKGAVDRFITESKAGGDIRSLESAFAGNAAGQAIDNIRKYASPSELVEARDHCLHAIYEFASSSKTFSALAEVAAILEFGPKAKARTNFILLSIAAATFNEEIKSRSTDPSEQAWSELKVDRSNATGSGSET